jgi:hypothetical protein
MGGYWNAREKMHSKSKIYFLEIPWGQGANKANHTSIEHTYYKNSNL